MRERGHGQRKRGRKGERERGVNDLKGGERGERENASSSHISILSGGCECRFGLIV